MSFDSFTLGIYILTLLWKGGEIAPEEQFLLLSTIFYLLLSFYVRTGNRISLRDKQLFEITEVEIARVDCSSGVLFDTLWSSRGHVVSVESSFLIHHRSNP